MNSEREGVRARDAAALAILEEIARLAAAAKPRIAAMLRYLQAHLFDRELSVAKIRKACGLRDNSVALQFHHDLGLPPARFIATCRQAVAEKMLTETWLPIWQISHLLGYSSIQVFSRSFFRISGLRPKDFRQNAYSTGGAPEARPDEPAAQGPDLLERALAGEADDEEAARLIGKLLEIYPPRRAVIGSLTR